MNGKLSSLAAPVYFINQCDDHYPIGYYILAPYSNFPTPYGWLRYEADDLRQVDRLQKILLSQELDRARREHIREEVVFAPLKQKVRDSLYARMISGSTSEYEKDFIRDYLAVREEKRAKHAERFYHRGLFMHAREMDATSGRKPNEEVCIISDVEKRLADG
jgi:hypothetical protein